MLHTLVAKSTYINKQKCNSRTSLTVRWLITFQYRRCGFKSLVGELGSHMPHGQKKTKYSTEAILQQIQ